MNTYVVMPERDGTDTYRARSVQAHTPREAAEMFCDSHFDHGGTYEEMRVSVTPPGGAAELFDVEPIPVPCWTASKVRAKG